MNRDEDGPIALVNGSDIASVVPLWDTQQVDPAESDPAKLFASLLATEQWTEALRLMPYLLPIRRAVWFGCLCAWLARGGTARAREDESLGAAVHWVRQPSASNHALARSLAENTEEAAIVDSCCQAAAWAGYRQEDGTWIDGDPPLAARHCVSALFATLAESDRVAEISPLQLLAVGIEVSQGKSLW